MNLTFNVIRLLVVMHSRRVRPIYPQVPRGHECAQEENEAEKERDSLSVCKSEGSNEGTNCNRRITSLSLSISLHTLWILFGCSYSHGLTSPHDLYTYDKSCVTSRHAVYRLLSLGHKVYESVNGWVGV